MNYITFSNNAKKFILSAFSKTVDEQEFIVETSNKNQRVLTPDGEQVELENFAGIKKGSEVFIKNDLISLIKFAVSR
jgi:hypothetical protein